MSEAATDTNTKPRKGHVKRPHLSPLQKLVARQLLVERRAPIWMVASAFQISEASARRLRAEALEGAA